MTDTATDIATIIADIAFEDAGLNPRTDVMHLRRDKLIALLADAFDHGRSHEVRVAINENAARGGREDA